ncbi:hypothetical protein GV794_08480 [Nocardia cyriacigeorgica]|uniref:Uncharacterized protein n=1 Tax=Nocardia cyriacigeorgica TaxID=135487 RepID=A0A6P1D5L3_9NOCA|nr:hypothetical protein [Nocardia cyriacigeorgica]NEW45916.1 hypothetical protein [Nocardia cyriacigeorgica]NEW50947.1 hypothetical protein [Nocardia cyriacigeorgica]NEW55687.1 hypothetical protein [Nocardia cyriacigeorgica]
MHIVIRSIAGALAAIALALGFVVGGSGPAVAQPTTVFPVPVVFNYTFDLSPSVGVVHVSATPTGTPGETALVVDDPIFSLIPFAPSVQVNWRNLDTGANGTIELPTTTSSTTGMPKPVVVTTGTGLVTATVFATSGTVIPGFGAFQTP